MKLIKVLITGGNGFLGRYIIEELRKNNRYEIYSFSRKTSIDLNKLGINQINGDLRNQIDVENAVMGMDAVIHSASLVGMWGKYNDFYEVNVLGTQNLINSMKRQNVTKLVYTSTPSVAFGNKSLIGVDEKTPYPKKYLSFYAKTKSMAEQKVLMANDEHFHTTALRPHLIFGPGDLNLIPRLIESHKKGRLKIIGDGKNLVDVTFVENAARAHVMALEKLELGSPICGKAYFLGQGPVNLWDFTNSILIKSGMKPINKKIALWKAYILGFLVEIFLKTFRLYNIHPPMTRFIALQLGTTHYFNHYNLENDLGFTPEISIEEGLKRLFEKTIDQ